jgi:hypothetical protein
MNWKRSAMLTILGWFVVVGLLAAPTTNAEPTQPQLQAPEPGEVTESSSPSQEVRQRIEHIRRNEFFYQSFGKQDPFKVLVDGDYVATAGAELVELNAAKLVGVMWGMEDRFALVEDGDGFGYILRVGDRIRHGRVIAIGDNNLRARISLYGISNTVTLKLKRTEG